MRSVRALLAVVVLAGALAVGGGVEDQGAPEQRAEVLLARMTAAEKLTLLHGGAGCGYVGCVDGIERLGIPPLHLQDGPSGVGSGMTGVTQLPAPVAAAASWDPALLRAYGHLLGTEHRDKGTDVVLAPTVNIVRDPRWGRAFESLGEDPYLAATAAAAELAGIRAAGPMAQVKHYAVYNQETGRNTPAGNAVVDERTLREIYLPAFEAAVGAGTESVMCGYNPVNGVFPCENGELQERILRDDLGFDGFVTSDWDATHSTVASLTNGLDLEMPDDEFFGEPLAAAAARGEVDLDVPVRRILTAMFRNGMFDRGPTGDPRATVTSAAHAATARTIAEQGAVLLRNEAGALPVGADVTRIAVLGSGAGSAVLSQGGGSARVDPAYVVSPYAGIKARAGDRAEVTYEPGVARADGALPIVPAAVLGGGFTSRFHAGTAFRGAPVATGTAPLLDADWRGGDPGIGRQSDWSGRWTGTLTPPESGQYTFSLTHDGGGRLVVAGRTLVDTGPANGPVRTSTGTVTLTAGDPVPVTVEYAHHWGNGTLALGWTLPGRRPYADAVAAARRADLAVVVVGRFGREGADLPDIELSPAENALVRDVAAVNRRTIVVVNSGSAVTMPWSGTVPAIVAAWYPGQEYGHALARLLFGDVNFTGKLPVTFPRTLRDVPAATPDRWPGGAYSERLEVGYRWYDAQGRTPLFPFGHGLSYTTFAYADLVIGSRTVNGSVPVTFTVRNTGTRAGAEVAQVYVAAPAAAGSPPRALRGFARVPLAPGESKRVTAVLDARSFQQWDGGWRSAPGAYGIAVGSSSRDLRLSGAVGVG